MGVANKEADHLLKCLGLVRGWKNGLTMISVISAAAIPPNALASFQGSNTRPKHGRFPSLITDNKFRFLCLIGDS